MKRTVGITLMLVAGLAGAQSLVERVPGGKRQEVNPYSGDERARQAGAKLYARECAACHGPAGEGTSSAPALCGRDVEGAPPGALYWVLRNGSLRRGMPSFSHLPAPQRWQIITYVKSLSSARP
jgi:mono/diheme cytochrome c family protein